MKDNNSINARWWSINSLPPKNNLLLLADQSLNNFVYISSNDLILFMEGKIKHITLQNGSTKKIVPSEYSYWKRIG